MLTDIQARQADDMCCNIVDHMFMRVCLILFQSQFSLLFSLSFATFLLSCSRSLSPSARLYYAHPLYLLPSYSLSFLTYCQCSCSDASFPFKRSSSLMHFYFKASQLSARPFLSLRSYLFFCSSSLRACLSSFTCPSWTSRSLFSLPTAASHSAFSLPLTSLSFSASALLRSHLAVSSRHLALMAFSSAKYCALYCWYISLVCLSSLSKSSMFLSLISISFLRCSSSVLDALPRPTPSLTAYHEYI